MDLLRMSRLSFSSSSLLSDATLVDWSVLSDKRRDDPADIESTAFLGACYYCSSSFCTVSKLHVNVMAIIMMGP